MVPDPSIPRLGAGNAGIRVFSYSYLACLIAVMIVGFVLSA